MKNIDETVESVLPDAQERVRDHDRILLKQALTEGKLCVPMRYEEIFIQIKATYLQKSDEMFGIVIWQEMAKAIYESQFK